MACVSVLQTCQLSQHDFNIAKFQTDAVVILQAEIKIFLAGWGIMTATTGN